MGVVLLLDQQCVAESSEVSFRLNQAVKHPENPVMLPGEPHQWDGLQVSWPATVLYSPSDSKFRCWYSGFDVIQAPGRFWRPGYAESGDGVHWIKPELDQVTFLDRPTNQLKLPGYLSLVCENPVSSAPEERFIGYTTEHGGETVGFTKVLYYSPDGINWSSAGVAYKGVTPDRPAFQDISQLVFDPEEPDPDYRFKGYSQLIHKRQYDGREGVRHIGLAHGPSVDRIVDAPEPMVLAPEEGIDEELHFAAVKKIGEQYLMLFESDRFARNPIHGDLKLAVSSDGRRFRRAHPEQPLVATGSKGVWDENLLVTTSSAIQEVGDEVCIFYIGCPNIYNSWPPPYMVAPERRGSMFAPAYLGLAILLRDRYACAVGPGWLTTHSLNLGPAGELWLNAEGDDVSLTAIEETGSVICQGRLVDERRKGVYRKVVWGGRAPACSVRLKVSLGAGTALYSIDTGT